MSFEVLVADRKVVPFPVVPEVVAVAGQDLEIAGFLGLFQQPPGGVECFGAELLVDDAAAAEIVIEGARWSFHIPSHHCAKSWPGSGWRSAASALKNRIGGDLVDA